MPLFRLDKDINKKKLFQEWVLKYYFLGKIVPRSISKSPTLNFSLCFLSSIEDKQMAGKTFDSAAIMKYAPWIAGAVALLYVMNMYSGQKGMTGESMMDNLNGALGSTGPLAEQGPYSDKTMSVGGNAQPTESLQHRKNTGQSTYSESTLSAEELLPKGEIGAAWASVNPSATADLKGQNFLQAGYHTNTALAGVAQTNRNSSWDVRSETANPQGSVGPFLNTTIEPNLMKRGLDA